MEPAAVGPGPLWPRMLIVSPKRPQLWGLLANSCRGAPAARRPALLDNRASVRHAPVTMIMTRAFVGIGRDRRDRPRVGNSIGCPEAWAYRGGGVRPDIR
ncbi:unnamed protein product, partial [Iphiclides podalirius]